MPRFEASLWTPEDCLTGCHVDTMTHQVSPARFKSGLVQRKWQLAGLFRDVSNFQKLERVLVEPQSDSKLHCQVRFYTHRESVLVTLVLEKGTKPFCSLWMCLGGRDNRWQGWQQLLNAKDTRSIGGSSALMLFCAEILQSEIQPIDSKQTKLMSCCGCWLRHIWRLAAAERGAGVSRRQKVRKKGNELLFCLKNEPNSQLLVLTLLSLHFFKCFFSSMVSLQSWGFALFKLRWETRQTKNTLDWTLPRRMQTLSRRLNFSCERQYSSIQCKRIWYILILNDGGGWKIVNHLNHRRKVSFLFVTFHEPA